VNSFHCFYHALDFRKIALFSIGSGFTDREPSVMIFVV